MSSMQAHHESPARSGIVLVCDSCGISFRVGDRPDEPTAGMPCPRCGLASLTIRTAFPTGPEPTERLRVQPPSAEEHTASQGPSTERVSMSSRRASKPAFQAPSPGTPRRIGRYRVVSVLGRGGMGVVYRAWDDALQRQVAIKTLGSVIADREDLERFAREARLGASLRHPHIVGVHEIGWDEGIPFIVMDHIEGVDLERALADQRLPPRTIAEIVRQVATALGHAHESGVVHRDVKPQNVLLTWAGDQPHAWLTDFGLGRQVGGAQRLTVTGDVLGTPSYMSPEQATAERERQGAPTDVWALGAILYRALTGRVPFEGADPIDTIRRVLTHEPTPPRRLDPAIHADLETITQRCLDKDPRRRYPTGQAVADELSRYLAGAPIAARPLGRLERGGRLIRRRPIVTALAVVIALILGLGSLAFAIRAGGEDARLERARAEERTLELDGAETDLDEAESVLRRARERTLVEDARPEDGEALLTSGVRTVHAALRLVDLAERMDRPDALDHARRRAFDLALEVGDDARDAERWSLARAMIEEADALAVDADRVAAASASLAALEGEGRDDARALIDDIVDRLERGELPPGPAREDALFQLVRRADATTVALIAHELDRVSDRLRAATNPIHRVISDPELADALTTLHDPRTESIGIAIAHTIHEADWRIDAVLERWGRIARAEAQGAAVPPGQGRVAQVLCEALGRIGIARGAVRPLARYALTEARSIPAAAAVVALVRLGAVSDDALQAAIAARVVFAGAGPAWSRAARALRQQPDGAARVRRLDLDGEPARAIATRGLISLELGDRDGATADFDRAVELDPTLADAWMARGMNRLANGDLEWALRDANQAISLDADRPSLIFQRGLIRTRMGRTADGLADLDLAIERAPRLYFARLQRAVIRAQTGDLEGGIEDLDAAIKEAPELPEAPFMLANVLYEQGDLGGAASAINAALALDPEHAGAWELGAQVRLRIQPAADPFGAWRYLERALAIEPDRPSALLGRANVRLMLGGDPDETIADLERTITLSEDGPVRAEARVILDHLRNGGR